MYPLANMLLIFNNYYNRTLKYCARKLRNNSTKYEKILWNYIRKKQIQNIQFYRQVSM